MWFIVVEVERETTAPPPKKNPGSAPALCWLKTLECKSNCKKMTIVIPVDNKLFTVPYMFQKNRDLTLIVTIAHLGFKQNDPPSMQK